MSGHSLVRRRHCIAATALFLFLFLVSEIAAAGAEPVGRVLVAVGDVTAVRSGESARGLTRNASVYQGDRIHTGPDGRVQIRFVDDALLDLQPSTKFEITQYREPQGDRGGSVVLDLLRGALRKITGAIAHGANDTYRMDTPVATIGVRGTEYALDYCDAACVEAGGSPGLYGHVDEGTISVDNAAGSVLFRQDQFFFVPAGGAPRAILQPPANVLVGDGVRSLDDARDGSGAGFAATVITPVREDTQQATVEPFLQQAGDLGGSITGGDTVDTVTGAVPTLADGLFGGAFTGTGGAGSTGNFDLYASPADASMFLDSGGHVVGADFRGSGTIDTSGMTLAESGSTTLAGARVNWGRWNGGFSVNGSDYSDGGFTYAYTALDNLSQPSLLQSLVGTFTYGDAGGPLAVDQSGNAWNVDALSLNVSFLLGNSTIGLNQMQLSNGTSTVQFLQSSGDLVSSTLDLAGNTFGLVLGGTEGSGNIDGRFIGTDAQGAIVVFEVDSASGNLIDGTRLLTQSP